MDAEDALKNASNIVYPNAPTLLCTWHVGQCVLANCKSRVGEDDWPSFDAAWRNVIQSRTVEEFEDRWLQFQITYSNEKTGWCVTYLKKEWLKDGQKERLVTAWTDRYQHFGCRVTSRFVLFALI